MSNIVTAHLYIGTSGWSYPKGQGAWDGIFYPPKLPSKKFLEYFATRLNSVEVNYTYRVLASEKLLHGWLECTPPHFRFSFKAHQMITQRVKLPERSLDHPW